MITTVMVVACYNQAARLDTDAFQTFIQEWRHGMFLFVDDGGTDDTFPIEACSGTARRPRLSSGLA